MLYVATPMQEDTFLQTRKLSDGGMTESDFIALNDIIASKDLGASCPRCKGAYIS